MDKISMIEDLDIRNTLHGFTPIELNILEYDE